jgi:Chitobiase/beta-hexosaminidase C-terminal domain/Bacterial Ig-like domain (group 3)/Beta-propeller repeat
MCEGLMLRSNSCLQNAHKVLLLASIFLPTVAAPIALAYNSSARMAPDKSPVVGSYSALPLSFERNDGQVDSHVRYFSRGTGYLLSLSDNDAVITLRKKAPEPTRQNERGSRQFEALPVGDARTDSIRMSLVDSSQQAKAAGDDPLPGTVNYFLGSDPSRWRSGVPTFKRVKYTGVYPGVNLVYYGNQRQLEFDFEVAPNADPSPIELSFAGARKLKLNRDGDLIISTSGGEVSFHKPVIYQTVAGVKQPVEGRFRLDSSRTVKFSLGAYDHTKSLIIDPILGYSTYLGDASFAQAVAVDSAGNAYVTGSTEADFPTTPGAFQNGKFPKLNPMDYSVYVTKFNSTGTALLYSTYIGGSNDDQGMAIAVDSNGNAYVGGLSYSSDFPVTSGAFQSSNHSVSIANGFVAKLNSTGTQLIYSTYLGGTNEDVVRAIAVDASGNAYVSGTSESSDFPVTPGAFQSTNKIAQPPYATVFLTKLNSSGSGLMYSTYLGGSCDDEIGGISLDALGFVYLAGNTCSTDFPTTPGAFETTPPTLLMGNSFVTKMNPTGSGLAYSTYLEGGAQAIAVDSSGDAYVTGFDLAGFPTTPGAFQPAPHGGSLSENVFVAKLNPSASALIYATYLGGSKSIFPGNDAADWGSGIQVNASGEAIVTGYASTIDFPVTTGAFQTQNNTMLDSGDFGSFLAKFNSTGSALLYSTFLGGSGAGYFAYECGDCVLGMTLDSSGNVYLVGKDESSDFPLSLGAYQSLQSYGFVTMFNANEMVTLPATTTTVTANVNPQATETPAIFTAQVQPASGDSAPTGWIGFSADLAPWWVTTLDSTGSATYSISTLPSGPNSIAVQYYGDDNNAPSTATMIENIDITSGNLPSVMSLTASANPVNYGTSVAFTVSVQDPSGKGVPEGTIRLQSNGGPAGRIGTLDITGKTIITTDQLPAGTDQVSAIFFPSNNSYASSNDTITENVTPLGATPAPVFSVPSGTYTSAQTVTLSDSSPSADVLYSYAPVVGLFSEYQQPFVVSGSETIEAMAVIAGYSPSPLVSVTYVIAPNGVAPTPTISPASGTYTFAQQINITDSVNPANIYYTTDGTTPTLSSTAYGNAFQISSSQTIKAMSFADGYSPSAVASATYTINLAAPSFTVSGTAVTITPGATTANTSTISLTPAGGFTGSVALTASVTSSPTGAQYPPTLSFGSTSPVSITGTTAGIANLTVTTTAATSSSLSDPKRPGAPWYAAGGATLACLLLFGMPARRRSSRTILGMLALLVALTASVMACSGGGNGGGGGGGAGGIAGTTAGNYTITLTGTSGSTTETGTVTLTVQ